jgi:predicted phosphodiesterase
VRPLTLISDLHVDVNQKHGIAEKFVEAYKNYDGILVIAGDWCEGHNPLFFEPFQELFAENPRIDIVFVPGNHDYYGIGLGRLEEKLEDFAKQQPRFRTLLETTTYIDNICFVGSTLWYPDTPDVWLLQNQIADFSEIPNFKPQDAIDKNAYAKNHIFDWVAMAHFTVWITHHAPSYQSIPRRFKGSRLNCYFYDPYFEKQVIEKRPNLLIHGHVHNNCNYQLGSTRVLANPHGYGNTGCENSDFDWFKHLIWVY